MKTRLVWIFGLLVVLGHGGDSSRFEHKTGGDDFGHETEWTLDSRGLLAHVVNLDALPDVTVAVNQRGVVIVNLRDISVVSEWKPGLYITGTNVRQRQGTDVRRISIVKKIETIHVVSPTKVHIIATDVSALELINDAKMLLKYPHSSRLGHGQGHRHKRYVSNLISKVLDKINFHANNSNQVITFNRDPITGNAIDMFNVFREKDQKDIKVTRNQGNAAPADAEFILKCTNCYEERRLGQVMDLEVERRNKSAEVKKFLLQNQVNSILNMKFDIEFKKALGLQETILLDSTPETQLRSVPVAVVDEKLPAIHLVTTYSKSTFLQINATSEGPLKYTGSYRLIGNYTSSSTETSGQVPDTQVTTSHWSVSGTTYSGQSSKPYNISMALYQQVTIKTRVTWSQHDVSIVFTPPEVATIRPVLYARTNEDLYSRCEAASLTVDSIFDYNKSDFIAKAFHKTIWDLELRKRTLIHETLSNTTFFHQCAANCPRDLAPSTGSMDTVCGNPGSKKIARGDTAFNKLTLVSGDFIIFQSEEAKQATWCEKQGRTCRACVWTDNNDNKADACADRLMTPEAATLLTAFGHFVSEEWPLRKLIVLEAWDEPTSLHQQGSHGVSSLHYIGRAIQVALSTEHPSQTAALQVDNSSSLLKRLKQLGTCAGFPFAEVTSTHVQLCVQDDSTTNKRAKRSAIGPPGNWEKDEFLKTLQRLGNVKQTCDPNNQTIHPYTVDEVINPVLEEPYVQDRLIQYPYDDIIFSKEGSPGSKCFHITRRCKTTCSFTHSIETWDWCQNRATTPRMAVRLRRLATFVKQKYPGLRVRVMKPQNGILKLTNLAKNGRALQISIPSNSTPVVTDFLQLATCAGFDFIADPSSKFWPKKANSTVLDVYVQLQDGFFTTVVHFPMGALNTVRVNNPDYDYPKGLMHEAKKTFLYDGFNENIVLSNNYLISHFKHPQKRFFRLDPSLVECLDSASASLDKYIEVIPNSAYRSHSINSRDLTHRHPEERLRFEAGQAVYVKIDSTKPQDLLLLVYAFLRTCPQVLGLQSRGLGIGCHLDKLYIDLRPMHDVFDIATSWSVGNPELYKKVSRTIDDLQRGGPAIVPKGWRNVCKNTSLGPEFAYYSFNSHRLGICFHGGESKFCKETKNERQKQVDGFRDAMMKVAGTTMTRGDIEPSLHACLLDNCGGCPNKGNIWTHKVHGCVQMLHTFLQKAKNPFTDVVDTAAFFNTENIESRVHSLACKDNSSCIENAQIYSLLTPLLDSKYRPNPSQTREELLFSGEDNPSPLLSMVEQEFARRVIGRVKVYIESEADLSLLREVIRILLIHNDAVTNVEFHLTHDVDEDDILSSIQRKVEYWAGSTCQKWSRFAVAPFDVHIIPQHRSKRSLEDSKSRNEVKRSMRDWEMEWLKKL